MIGTVNLYSIKTSFNCSLSRSTKIFNNLFYLFSSKTLNSIR